MCGVRSTRIRSRKRRGRHGPPEPHATGNGVVRNTSDKTGASVTTKLLYAKTYDHLGICNEVDYRRSVRDRVIRSNKAGNVFR